MQRLGYIHNMMDVKVLILYVAGKSHYPMTVQEIYELIVETVAGKGGSMTKVYNIKAYLLAALFNAGTTMSNYYRAEVNHDMPQFAG